MLKRLIIGLIAISCAISLAHSESASDFNKHISQHGYQKTPILDLQNTNLPEAIHYLARLLHLNVIISPSVHGLVRIRIPNIKAERAFDLLLFAHGLSKWQSGDIWFIATREEFMQAKQAELKWKAALDESASLTVQYWQMKYAKAEDIARLLHDEQMSLLSKQGRVRADQRTNMIYVEDNPSHLKTIQSFITHFDIPVQQILIETRLASVDNDFERELGVKFGLGSEMDKRSSVEGVFTGHQREETHYSLAIARLASGSLLDVKLSALEKAGHAELISSPSLFTANQQQASIEAGEEVPYQEVSDQGGTAVAFKKAVLGLKVTPHVRPGRNILLELQINQDRPSNKMVLGMPTISTRQIITNVLVKSGQTVVLGGIYEVNHEQGQQQVPFINRLPIIGFFFKQKVMRENKRQLLIFVTPKIINQDL